MGARYGGRWEGTGCKGPTGCGARACGRGAGWANGGSWREREASYIIILIRTSAYTYMQCTQVWKCSRECARSYRRVHTTAHKKDPATHVHTHASTGSHVCIYENLLMNTRTHTCAPFICMHPSRPTYTNIYVYPLCKPCSHICVPMYIHISVHICSHFYVHVRSHTKPELKVHGSGTNILGR